MQFPQETVFENDTENADEFRKDMIAYIKKHFSSLLGVHAALLDQADGLDRLAHMARMGAFGGKLDN